jgi:hypothetical protein
LALRELAFPHHKADIKFHAIACTKERIFLAVTNSGDRAGIMTEFSLRLVADSHVAGEEFALMPRKERRVVLPGETFTLELEPRIEGVLASLPAPGGLLTACEYRITTSVDAFDLGSSLTTVSCPCFEPRAWRPAS